MILMPASGVPVYSIRPLLVVDSSQLLVLELALKLLALGDLPDGLVEVVLVDCIAVVADGE